MVHRGIPPAGDERLNRLVITVVIAVPVLAAALITALWLAELR